MATNTVPAMPSVSNMSAGLIAPGEGPILSKADIGARSRYNAQLHVSAVAGSLVSDPELGEAVCVVHRAASLLNGTAGEGVGGKVDLLTADVAVVKSDTAVVKSRLASVEADMSVVKSDMAVVKSDLAEVKSDMAEVKSKLVSVEAMLAGIRAGQENVPHRNANGMSRVPDHPLEPLQAEVGAKVGEYPPADLFPASLSQVWALNNAALNNLEQFYGRSFTGPSMAARQSKFASFIGVYA